MILMKFDDTPVTMGDLREAESSNTAGMNLLAKHALNPDGTAMEFSKAIEMMSSLTMLEFYQLYQEFNKSLIPNLSGRRLSGG